MAQAVAQVDDYYHQNETLPEGIDGNKLLISAELSDAWGESLRYDRLEGERFHVRSAGPDREFDTADDLTRS